jgi:hypothetical protein
MAVSKMLRGDCMERIKSEPMPNQSNAAKPALTTRLRAKLPWRGLADSDPWAT